MFFLKYSTNEVAVHSCFPRALVGLFAVVSTTPLTWGRHLSRCESSQEQEGGALLHLTPSDRPLEDTGQSQREREKAYDTWTRAEERNPRARKGRAGRASSSTALKQQASSVSNNSTLNCGVLALWYRWDAGDCLPTWLAALRGPTRWLGIPLQEA